MEISPTFQLLNKLYKDINIYLCKHPKMVKDTQLIRNAILEVEIKLSNPTDEELSMNDVLDEIEFCNGINYDECKEY